MSSTRKDGDVTESSTNVNINQESFTTRIVMARTRRMLT